MFLQNVTFGILVLSQANFQFLNLQNQADFFLSRFLSSELPIFSSDPLLKYEILGPVESDIPHEYYGGDVTSLEELMSEELAKELQHEENLRAGFTPERSTQDDYSTNQSERVDELANQSAADESDVSSDWLMAQMLQKQFDQEHDKQIQRYEKVRI